MYFLLFFFSYWRWRNVSFAFVYWHNKNCKTCCKVHNKIKNAKEEQHLNGVKFKTALSILFPTVVSLSGGYTVTCAGSIYYIMHAIKCCWWKTSSNDFCFLSSSSFLHFQEAGNMKLFPFTLCSASTFVKYL